MGLLGFIRFEATRFVGLHVSAYRIDLYGFIGLTCWFEGINAEGQD